MLAALGGLWLTGLPGCSLPAELPADGGADVIVAEGGAGDPSDGAIVPLVCEGVEVDPATMAVDVKRYVVVHDCGRVLNPLILEGQIQGGVAQGLGNAFYEQLHYDAQGQLLNATFMDYLLPGATEVPDIESSHLERSVIRGPPMSDRVASRYHALRRTPAVAA